MALRNARPIVHSPAGLSDTLDDTNVFPGAMSALSNLIPDPSTKNLWQSRPASTLVADFVAGGFSSPGFVSVMFIQGTKVFGMVASARNAGHDEPFCFDLVAGTFTTVSGITNGNTPLSPATTGAWTPPTMDLVGVNLVVTHPGFSGVGGVMFGWFDLTTISAPVWHGGNTTTTLLPCPPTAVKQFFNRAYFICNPTGAQPSAYFTDVLTLTITDPTHIITFGDNVALTALGALPLNSQLTGGTIQSLIVFKGAAQMWQVTGDAALTGNPLNVNSMNVATGTLAPLTITPTPKGLAFVAPDGLRLIQFNGTITDPIGVAGSGVTVPFIYSVVPSRMAAACGGQVLRISVQNGNAAGTPNQEYWYDIPRQCWSGPHTFPASQIDAYNNTFIMAPVGVAAKLFKSDTAQASTSTYTENGSQMAFSWQTALLPDTGEMAELAMIETTLYMALTASATVQCSALDQNGAVLDSVSILSTGASTVWGAFIWGAALWQGVQNALFPRQLKWHIPIVFRRLALMAQGQCAAGFKIGQAQLRYQQLGYLQQDATGTSSFMGVYTTGTVTLTANATTTVVSNAAILPTSSIFMMPNTPDAANDAATTSWVAGTGSFTITHANNARTDRTFTYAVFN
jgi:hypothetical protein